VIGKIRGHRIYPQLIETAVRESAGSGFESLRFFGVAEAGGGAPCCCQGCGSKRVMAIPLHGDSMKPRLARCRATDVIGSRVVHVASQPLSDPTVPGTGALAMLAEAVLTIDALGCRARRWRRGGSGTGHAGTVRVDVMGALVAR
jgi:hypothetical protein